MSHSERINRAFLPEQQRLVLVVWLTYALFYLGRVNLSPALSSIADSLRVTRAEVGFLGTAFFWTYAIGQIINGQLGNRVSPRKIVAAGLLIIAVANLAFSAQNSLSVMVLLWSLNALGHSTGWGPMLRILAERLDADQRRRISAWFAMSFQVGSAVTWALAGWLIAAGGWRMAFALPGLALLGVLAFWIYARVDVPARPATVSDRHFGALLTDTRRFWPIYLSALFVGFMQVSGIIWLPTYVLDTHLFPDAWVGAIAGAMPLLGAMGMLMAALMLQRIEDTIKTLILLLISTCLPLLIAAAASGVPQLLAVALAMLMIGGGLGVLISAIPMTMSPEGRASSMAGTITAVVNLGGGLASPLIGAVMEFSGWSTVFAVWALAVIAAAVIAIWAAHHYGTHAP